MKSCGCFYCFCLLIFQNEDGILEEIKQFFATIYIALLLKYFLWNNVLSDDLGYFSKLVQVNLCQKLSFLHQLTHNMTIDCLLNCKFNTWKFQAQNKAKTCRVLKLFLTFWTIFVHNTFSPGLSLEFSCIELVIQWTICCHIVG